MIAALDELTVLDFTAALPCEGTGHPTGVNGHVPSEPAAYMIRPPCNPMSTVVQCASRVRAMWAEDGLWCHGCSGDHPVEEFRFIPLNGED